MDAAENPSSISKKRPAAGNGKGREKEGKKDGAPVQRQATLFNMMGPKKDAAKKVKASADVSMSEAGSAVESQPETLAEDDWEETQLVDEDGQTLES